MLQGLIARLDVIDALEMPLPTVCSSTPANVNNANSFSCGSNKTPGQTCSTTCGSGFTGTPTVTCQANGTWSAAEPGCTQIGEYTECFRRNHRPLS